LLLLTPATLAQHSSAFVSTGAGFYQSESLPPDNTRNHIHSAAPRPGLDAKFSSKFYYVKRRFFITLKCQHIHKVLNVDEIKN
jgi:hypothetical protein